MNNKFKGMYIRKTGGSMALTKNEELTIIKGITISPDWGFAFSTIELQMFTKQFLEL